MFFITTVKLILLAVLIAVAVILFALLSSFTHQCIYRNGALVHVQKTKWFVCVFQTKEHSRPVGVDKAGVVESNGLELRGMRALFPGFTKIENLSKKVKGFSALDVANLLISEHNENCDLLDWSDLKKSPVFFLWSKAISAQ